MGATCLFFPFSCLVFSVCCWPEWTSSLWWVSDETQTFAENGKYNEEDAYTNTVSPSASRKSPIQFHKDCGISAAPCLKGKDSRRGQVKTGIFIGNAQGALQMLMEQHLFSEDPVFLHQRFPGHDRLPEGLFYFLSKQGCTCFDLGVSTSWLKMLNRTTTFSTGRLVCLSPQRKAQKKSLLQFLQHTVVCLRCAQSCFCRIYTLFEKGRFHLRIRYPLTTTAGPTGGTWLAASMGAHNSHYSNTSW